MDCFKKVIALDFDGVMTHPYLIKSEEFAKKGYKVPPSKTGRDNVLNVLNIPLKVYEEVSYSANVKRILEIPPEKEAIETCKLFLKNPKIKLYWVTRRYNYELKSLKNWLKKFNLPINQVLFSSRKKKGELLAKIRADIFIDDSLKNIEILFMDNNCQILKNYRLRKSLFYLFRNITNRNLTIKGKINEVKKWSDIHREVTNLIKNINLNEEKRS